MVKSSNSDDKKELMILEWSFSSALCPLKGEKRDVAGFVCDMGGGKGVQGSNFLSHHTPISQDVLVNQNVDSVVQLNHYLSLIFRFGEKNSKIFSN